MALTDSFPTQDPGGLTITDTRLVMAGLVAQNANGAPRVGVFPAGSAPLVTGRASMAYDVGVFKAATSRISPGVELVANNASTTVPTTAAPPSNSRLDVIWVRARFAQHADGSNLPEIGVTQGSPAAIPTKPAIPAGALELAVAEILSTATTTQSAVITQTGPLTAAAGGVVPVRNVTELAAYSAANGTLARDLSTGTLHSREDGAWVSLFGPLTAWSPTITGLTLGNGTLRTFYSERDRTVEFFIELESGSTTAATGTVGFSLPKPVANPAMHRHIGEGYFRYTGASVGQWIAQPRLAGGQIINATFLDASSSLLTIGGNVTNTFPTSGAWGGANLRPTLYLHGTYLREA